MCGKWPMHIAAAILAIPVFLFSLVWLFDTDFLCVALAVLELTL